MSVDDIRARVAEVRVELDTIPRRWSHPIQLVAVTKGFDGSVLTDAVRAGCTVVGENYAQELISKRTIIEELHPEVHFIGRLQSNKVRQLVGIVDVWASLDRPSIVREVARRAPGARVLIQVNATREDGKGGGDPDEVPELVRHARDSGLIVEGLMTVGPTGRSPEHARAGFRMVRALVDELNLTVCSMGMSADLRIAVEEGSTSVRLGTALFGPRRP